MGNENTEGEYNILSTIMDIFEGRPHNLKCAYLLYYPEEFFMRQEKLLPFESDLTVPRRTVLCSVC